MLCLFLIYSLRAIFLIFCENLLVRGAPTLIRVGLDLCPSFAPLGNYVVCLLTPLRSARGCPSNVRR